MSKRWSDSILARIKGIWPKFSVEISSQEYGQSLDLMAETHGKDTVDAAVTAARITDPEPPTINRLWELCREQANKRVKRGPLYDPNCPDCMEGWREMKWEEIDSKVRNRMVELYGFAQAQKETLVKRCHCWKVPA